MTFPCVFIKYGSTNISSFSVCSTTSRMVNVGAGAQLVALIVVLFDYMLAIVMCLIPCYSSTVPFHCIPFGCRDDEVDIQLLSFFAISIKIFYK